MTVTQIEITKKALLDVELMEIKYWEGFPDIDFTPSQVYVDKIKKIITSERKRESSFLKLSARKKLTLLIASVIILLLTLSACVFKDQIKDFVIEAYDSMTRFFSPHDESISDYQEYSFTYIPEGYKLEESFELQNWAEYKYSNSKHHIYITQSELSGNSIQIDTEDASFSILNINNIKIYRTNKNNTYAVVWRTNTTAFSIVCHDSIKWSEIEKMILGAIPKS